MTAIAMTPRQIWNKYNRNFKRSIIYLLSKTDTTDTIYTESSSTEIFFYLSENDFLQKYL